jgi:small subunit ribosomal protein S7
MRRKLNIKREIEPDLEYKSEKVSKLINVVMERGKKNTARRVVYGALTRIKEKESAGNPLEAFENAVRNVGPTVEVRSRRVGGANYQVPREVRPNRRLQLALRWIVDAARAGKGRPMAEKLADEILAASRNEGDAAKKRENVHRMAEANKAFAHFSW